ncbi:MAG TPA: hypothetical protein VJC18_07355 [bacterium]|nr:hypothetical protein [bacterium]
MDEMIKSNDINEVASNFERFLKKEKEGLKKRNIVYIVSAALVFCFFTYIAIFTNHYVGPNLAFDYVQVKGIKQIAQINMSVKTAAPRVVSQWSNTLVTTMPNVFRQKMFGLMTPIIDTFADKFATDLRLELANLYKQDGMKAVLAGKVDVEEGYKRLFDQVNLSYTTQIANFYVNNVKAVNNLTNDLLRLENSVNLTEREKYAKKVIGAWLSLLDHKGAIWDVDKAVAEIKSSKKVKK